MCTPEEALAVRTEGEDEYALHELGDRPVWDEAVDVYFPRVRRAGR
ncbi:hypothetical protein [Nonomuraea sp. NPDC050783]